MKLPKGAVIPDEKLVRYLLLPRAWDDKSKFLAQAGFSRHPEALIVINDDITKLKVCLIV